MLSPRLLPLALLFPLAACFTPGGNAASHLAKPPEFNPPNQTKCSVKKSTEHPLIVEWPSADRATLEAKMQSGVVAVRYVGCEMEVLHRCKLPGKYAYTSITPKQENVTIKDSDELYAKMPVGAAKLEGKLEKSGQLNVAMTIVGHYEAESTTFKAEELSDDCTKATHVVSGMTTGAFELSAGASASVGGEASVMGVGAGGKSTSSHETLERDGQPSKCAATQGKSDSPPDGCGAVLRLDVVPLETPKRAKAVAVPDSTIGVDESGIAPALYETGNLRVAVRCAESETIVTPERGLRVLIDGKEQGEKALKTNMITSMGTQMVNNHAVPVAIRNFTDVGFLVPPGTHRLRIETPDCVALESDVKISGTHATNVEGDMEVSTPSLKGPVGAPWGGGFALGAIYGSVPLQVGAGSEDILHTSYKGDQAGSMYGGFMGFTIEHRYFAGGLNYGVTSGSLDGTYTDSKGSRHFSASPFGMLLDLQFGARLPLQYVALQAGSGIGGSMWIVNGKVDATGTGTGTGESVGGVRLLWHVPLWAAATIKPFCNWGVRVGAQYNVQPTQFDGNYFMSTASVLYQPSPSCERTANLSISP